ncbi:MAG: ATP-binding protein [Gammaproteobacteria bacterium]
MNYSLRHLLLVTLLSASMLIWGVTAFYSYKVTRNEVSDLFDAELAQSAKVLLTFVESISRDGSLPDYWKGDQSDQLGYTYPLGSKYERKLAFQLWSEDNVFLSQPENKSEFSVDEAKDTDKKNQLWNVFEQFMQTHSLPQKYERKIAFQLWSKKRGLLLRSDSAPKFSFSPTLRGFSKATVDNDLWHIYSIANTTGDYVIHVAQKEEIRTELSDEISQQLVTQFLFGLPILGVFIWLIVGHSLKPINHLEKSISRREASFLKPLRVAKLPNEIVPVVKELNNLFVQLEEAFEHERRFSADASHELRTPLAGLLTQVQVALRTEDDGVRRQALKRIEQAVNRMTYMVQQLLTFSRIESGVEYLMKQPMQLSHEVVLVISDIEPEAHKKRIQMEFVDENAPQIIANAQLLNILIRNIIDNAIKYTPTNGTILITLIGREKKVELCIEDSGPGIAPDQYEKSLQRFHRCVETASSEQGTGLGFSIVQRIAKSHGAEISLGVSQFGGLKVTVSFPLPRRKADKRLQKKFALFPAKNK